MAGHPFALTVFTVGYEFGRLWAGVLVLVLGVVAIVFGVRMLRRRSATPPPPAVPLPATWSPPSAPPESDPGFLEAATVVPAGQTPVQSTAPQWNAPTPAPAKASGGLAAPIVLLVVGVLLTVGGLARTIPTVSDDLTHHTVTIPETAGTLRRIAPTPAVQSAMDSMKSELTPELEITNVQTGVYADSGSGQPAAILLVAEIAGNPDANQFFDGVAQGAQSSGTSLDLTPADTAGMPGDLRCGDVPVSGGTVGVCLWLDSDTVGMVFKVPGESAPTSDLANNLRAASEK